MSTNIIITGVTVSDSPALTRNNMSAFWGDPHWVLAWKHETLDYHISQVSLRMPKNLLTDRAIRRQQKAVDRDTGDLVGYARWILPESRAYQEDGTPAWPEAQVPAVSEEDEAEIKRVFGTARWNPNTDSDHIADEVVARKKRMLAGKEYIVLDYLAVHPERQRRGIGTALVKSGMEQAGRMGLDIFVYAKKQGVEVYKRLGFKIVYETVLDDSMYGGMGEVYVALLIYEQPRTGSDLRAADAGQETRIG